MWDVEMTKQDQIEALRVPVKKRCGLMYPLPATEIQDGELSHSGAETLQRTDEEVKEIRRKKALSYAIRLRVAEMQQPVTKRFTPLKGQMYPLTVTENTDDSEQIQSGVESFQSIAKKKSYAMSTKRNLALRQKLGELLKLEQKTRGGITNDTATNLLLGLGRITSGSTTRCGGRTTSFVTSYYRN